MGTYVVGDIHGCFKEWIELKNRIEARDSNAKFILVGDIIDRGSQVVEMVLWALENITENGKYQMILGNHEDAIIQWWDYYRDFIDNSLIEAKNHISFRDYEKDNYNFQASFAKTKLNDNQMNEIINFFRKLPVYKELYVDTGRKDGKPQHYLVVHSAIAPQMMNKDETFKKRSVTYTKKYNIINTMKVDENRKFILWTRLRQGHRWLNHTVVIHGHTPTIFKECLSLLDEVDGRILYRHADINVDTGIVYDNYRTRNLSAIRLEDLEEFYLFEPPYRISPSQQAMKYNLLNMIHGLKFSKKWI